MNPILQALTAGRPSPMRGNVIQPVPLSLPAMGTPEEPRQPSRGAPQPAGTVRSMVQMLAEKLGLAPTTPSAPTSAPAAIPSLPGSTSVASTQPPAPTTAGVGDPVAADLPPVARALLNSISVGESGGKYDVRYSPQGPQRFEGTQHPNIREAGPHGPSSAAGRYQFTGTTWNAMGGGNFTPVRQDQQAWALAQRDYAKRTGRDLTKDLQERGLTDETMRVLAPTWAAFKNENVRKRSMQEYAQSLGRYDKEALELERGKAPVQPVVSEQLQDIGALGPKSPLAPILQQHADNGGNSDFKNFAETYNRIAGLGPDKGIGWENMRRSTNVEDVRALPPDEKGVPHPETPDMEKYTDAGIAASNEQHRNPIENEHTRAVDQYAYTHMAPTYLKEKDEITRFLEGYFRQEPPR